MALPVPAVWAAEEPVVEIVTDNGTTSSTAGVEEPAQSKFPLLISFGAHAGYDSNFETTSNPVGSWFADQQLTLAYDRTRGPTDLSIVSSIGVVERFGHGSDENGFLDLSLAHRVSERLTLNARINAAYQSEPNFTTNVGPTRRAGNYFSTADDFSAAYQWLRRFSTVSSFSLALVRYQESFTAAFSDRQQYTFGEEFRFNLLRNTVLVGDYRFQVVDYVTAPLDSTTHFALLGAEQSFSESLQAQIRAGASFRSFQQGGNNVNPVFEGALNYALARRSSISWTVGYSVEQPTEPGSLSQTTLRTGLQFRYGFTSRISAALGFNYQHNESQSGSSVTTAGAASAFDAYDLLLSLRYQINRHVDVDAGFQHSETGSAGAIQNYSRNIYSIGLNIAF